MSKSEVIRGLIEEIDIFKIRTSKVPLRLELRHIEQLAESIREKGLLQPIIVRPEDDCFYEVVAGHRRYSACKLLHWRKIPCHIVDLDDKEAFEISLTENLQRKTLNPIEEAEAFRKYVCEFGWGGVSDLSKKIGKSPAYVTKRIKLLSLPLDIIERIENSAITASVAEELFSVNDKSTQSELARLISARHLSFRHARALISQNDLNSDNQMLCSENSVVIENVNRTFDKAIVTLRYCMGQLSTLIDSAEDSWLLHEMLMEHRSILHSQIDLLLKQKREFSRHRMT